MCCEEVIQHQERAEKQTDFPSEKMPWCCVQCSASPCSGQQTEILNINASKGPEIGFLSYKNSLGSRGFPVPLSTLCPSVLQIAIIISSKRKWAAFAKKRQKNSSLCQTKEEPPIRRWLFFNKGLFLLKCDKMCVIVNSHTNTYKYWHPCDTRPLFLWWFCSKEKYVSLTQCVFLACNAYINPAVSYSITTVLVSALPLQLTLFGTVWMKQGMYKAG